MEYSLDKNNLGDAVSPVLYGSAIGEGKVQPKFLRFAKDYEAGFLCAKESGAIPVPVFDFQKRPLGTEEFEKETVDRIASVLFYAKGDPGSSFEKEAFLAQKRAEAGQNEPFPLSMIEIHSPDREEILYFLRHYDIEGEMIDLLQTFSVRVIAEGGDVEFVQIERTLPACIDACGKIPLLKRETMIETVGTSEGQGIAEAVLLTAIEQNSRIVMASADNSDPSVLSLRGLFAERLGDFSLKNIAPVSKENGGGVMIGGEKTSFLICSVAIRSLKGELLYYHSFRDGAGDWKPMKGESLCFSDRGELRLDDGFIVLEGDYTDVEIEVECKRLSGRQCFTVGAGVRDGYAVAVSYGKNECGYGVCFEKWVDGVKVASSFKGRDAFVGYSGEGNRIKLRYTENGLQASFYQFGAWHPILDESTCKVNGRSFASATCTEDDKVFFKCVNAGDEEEEAKLVLRHFGEKTKARLVRFPDEREICLSVMDNALSVSVPPKSAILLVIE